MKRKEKYSGVKNPKARFILKTGDAIMETISEVTSPPKKNKKKKHRTGHKHKPFFS